MTDWANLTGLELRRAVIKAKGWKYYRGRSTFVRKIAEHFAASDNHGHFDAHGFDVLAIADAPLKAIEGYAPAVESSADISEAWLDEECKKRDRRWMIFSHRDGYRCEIYPEYADPADEDRDVIADGSTPSEARARALLQLLRESEAK